MLPSLTHIPSVEAVVGNYLGKIKYILTTFGQIAALAIAIYLILNFCRGIFFYIRNLTGTIRLHGLTPRAFWRAIPEVQVQEIYVAYQTKQIRKRMKGLELLDQSTVPPTAPPAYGRNMRTILPTPILHPA